MEVFTGRWKFVIATGVLCLVVPLEAWYVYADFAGLNEKGKFVGNLAGAMKLLRGQAKDVFRLKEETEGIKQRDMQLGSLIKEESSVVRVEKTNMETLEAEVEGLKSHNVENLKDLQEMRTQQRILVEKIAVPFFTELSLVCEK